MDKHLVIVSMTVIAVVAMFKITDSTPVVHDIILALGSIATGYAWGDWQAKRKINKEG